jgi:hypothetical protein
VNYSVAWSDLALDALAAIWLAATNRNAVTQTAHEIELEIAANPNATGTIVFDTVREYTRPPLGVEFEVVDADRRVFVLSVWDAALGRPATAGN